MDLLRSDQTKVAILRTLAREGEMTLNALRREVGKMNYFAIRRACLFLELVRLLQTERRAIGEREFILVRLTESGRNVAKKL